MGAGDELYTKERKQWKKAAWVVTAHCGGADTVRRPVVLGWRAESVSGRSLCF